MELLCNGHSAGRLLPPLLSLPTHKGQAHCLLSWIQQEKIRWKLREQHMHTSLEPEDACTASLDEAAWWNCEAELLAGMSCQLFHTLSAEGTALDAIDSNVMRCLGDKKTGIESVIGQSREMEPVGQTHPREKLRR